MKNNKFVLGLLLGLTFFLLMGAFTRDWIESTPTDSTVANQIDDFNRGLRVDASDRLKEMIYGFTNGENSGNPGFKELIFKQQASAPGTTNADEITLYSIDDGAACGLYAIQESGYTKQLLKVVGSDINFVIETADIPADLIDSVHYAANSIDPEHLVDDFTFDTFPLSPSAAPDADYELANKKYVDADHPAYSGGESHTDGSGMITKMGTASISANSSATVTFGTAFPNDIVSAVAVYRRNVEDVGAVYFFWVKTKSTTNLIVFTSENSNGYFDWIAIGY